MPSRLEVPSRTQLAGPSGRHERTSPIHRLNRQIEKSRWDIDWNVETMSLYLMDTVDPSLADSLPSWLARQRWYTGKGRTPELEQR